jgi:hypothetical protein
MRIPVAAMELVVGKATKEIREEISCDVGQ